jgi:hypothetical protein
MIDNSVWVEASQSEQLAQLIREISQKHEIRTSEVTDEEVNQSVTALAGKNSLSENLWKLYSEAGITGHVKRSAFVESLADEYSTVLRPSKRQIRRIKSDLLLAASATADSIDFILTFNRSSLASEEFQIEYRKTNESHNLKTPQFLTTVDSFRRLLLL